MPLLPKENIYGHTKKLFFILDQIKQFAKQNPGIINLLDFGCGNGSAVSQFLMLENVNYYGLDMHLPSLEYAMSKFSKENVQFVSELPAGVTFDIIVYSDILEHLDAPEQILKSHCSLLKDNGIIIGSIPNGYGPFEIEKKIGQWLHLQEFIDLICKFADMISRKKGILAQSIPYNNDSGHVQFFTKEVLFKLMNRCRLTITHFQNGSFVGAPYSERILKGERIAHFNTKIADCLPYWMVSTWYFAARKDKIK